MKLKKDLVMEFEYDLIKAFQRRERKRFHKAKEEARKVLPSDLYLVLKTLVSMGIWGFDYESKKS